MSIEQLINDLADGNTAKAKESLDSVLADKATAALDAHKIEIASRFNKQDEDEMEE